MNSNNAFRKAMSAFVSLIALQVGISVFYKLSVNAQGGYNFSPPAILTMSEILKILIATVEMILSEHRSSSDKKEGGGGRQRSIGQTIKICVRMCLHHFTFWNFCQISVLAMFYSVNNKLNFHLMAVADPGTVFMFKAINPLFTAILSSRMLNRGLRATDWDCLILQVLGLVVMQYDSCKHHPILSPSVYIFLFISALLTSGTNIFNEFLVKDSKIPVGPQSIMLYFAGAVCNFSSFISAEGWESLPLFFRGFEGPAFGVLFCIGFVGMAVTQVYIHCDVHLKNMAASVTSVFSLIMSFIFFGLVPTVPSICGSAIILVTSHVYLTVGSGASAGKYSTTTTTANAAVAGNRQKWKWVVLAIAIGLIVAAELNLPAAKVSGGRASLKRETTATVMSSEKNSTTNNNETVVVDEAHDAAAARSLKSIASDHPHSTHPNTQWWYERRPLSKFTHASGARAGIVFESQPSFLASSSLLGDITASLFSIKNGEEVSAEDIFVGNKTAVINNSSLVATFTDLQINAPGSYLLKYTCLNSPPLTQNITVLEKPMTFTFGIQTVDCNTSSWVQRAVNEIDNMNIPQSQYEVLIVGPIDTCGVSGKNIRFIPAPDSECGDKKIIIAEQARHDILVIMHESVIPNPDFYSGFLKFGNNFDVAGVYVDMPDGVRQPSLMLGHFFPNLMIYYEEYFSQAPVGHHAGKSRLHLEMRDLWFERETRRESYHESDWVRGVPEDIRLAMQGGKYAFYVGYITVVKRDTFLRFPYPSKQPWGTADDVRWSFAVSHMAPMKFNPFSSVSQMRQKATFPLLSREEFEDLEAAGLAYD